LPFTPLNTHAPTPATNAPIPIAKPVIDVLLALLLAWRATSTCSNADMPLFRPMLLIATISSPVIFFYFLG
jgi:hypothetical protein